MKLSELIEKHGLPVRGNDGVFTQENEYIEFTESTSKGAIGFHSGGCPFACSFHDEDNGWSLYQEPKPKLRAWIDTGGGLYLAENGQQSKHWKPVKFNAEDNTWEIEELEK